MILKKEAVVAERGRSVERDDWAANWIWSDTGPRPRNLYLYARKTFQLSFKPQAGKLRITADSRYKLFVNGKFVGRGPVRFEPRSIGYDTYDVSQLLVKGRNVIAVLVHHIGQGTYSYIPGRAAMICQLDVQVKDKTETFVTDETWKVQQAAAWTSAGVRMSRRLGFQEVYDASLEPKEWTQPGFKDQKWQNAVVLGKPPMHPFDHLTPREIPHLHEEVVLPAAIVSVHDCPPLPEGMSPPDMPRFMASEKLSPIQQGRINHKERLLTQKDEAATIRVPQSGGVSVILDFGREVSGCVELSFTGAQGGIVDIGYSEALDSGRVKPNRGDVRYTDRLILRKGKQTWCSFETRAFRYLQMDFRNCPKAVSISRVIVREVTYPVRWRGSFECSDQALNQIWKTAAETVRLCMQDTYVDGPWRERAQWWDGAAIASKVAYFAFGDTALLRQGIKHIAASQQKDGAVAAIYPSATWVLFPDFGAIWVMSIWDYYVMSDDKDLAAEVYPVVVAWLKWLRRFTDRDGLLSRVRGDLFIDWAEIDRRGEVAALNCLYLGALRAACLIAEMLRHKSDAEEWAGLASELKTAIVKHFWSPTRGLFADARVDGKLQEHYSRQTNILAALFDAADHYQKSSIYRQTLDEKGLPPITTPRLSSFLTEALLQSGYASQAMDLIRQKWGKMISSGATTLWEYFSPTDSLCYASSASPAYQLQAYVLGIKPIGEARRIKIEPHPGDLKWAKGVLPTHNGDVAVEWKSARTGFSMTVEAPQGMTVEVAPPKDTASARVLIDGKDVYDKKIEIGSGSHRVQVLTGPSAIKAHRKAPEPVKRPEPLPIPPGRADIETVEQMIRILADLEKEYAEAALVQAEQQRARRRRSKRSKLEQTSEPEPLVEGTAPEPERPAKQRRRRSKSNYSEQKTEQAETIPDVEDAAAKNVEKHETAKQRKRRTSTKKKQQTADESAEVQTNMPADNPIEPAEPVKPEEKRPHTGHRKRKSNTQKAEHVEPAAAIPPDVEQASAEIAGENHNKSRRRYHRHRGSR